MLIGCSLDVSSTGENSFTIVNFSIGNFTVKLSSPQRWITNGFFLILLNIILNFNFKTLFNISIIFTNTSFFLEMLL